MYRQQYMRDAPTVQYNPLADGRQALIASTQTLRSHIPKKMESVQLQNHYQSLQHLPYSDNTSQMTLAAQGNVVGPIGGGSVPKHPGFDYKQTVAPSNMTLGMRGDQIAMEGAMRTASWDNETKMTSFALGDRSLDDVGLAAVGGSYRMAKASAFNSRELLDTHFSRSRKPLSGVVQKDMREEFDPLDRIYRTKRMIVPTLVMPPGINSRNMDIERRSIAMI